MDGWWLQLPSGEDEKHTSILTGSLSAPATAMPRFRGWHAGQHAVVESSHDG